MMVNAFAAVMPRALAIIGARGLVVAPKVKRLFEIWRSRQVFSEEQVAAFEQALEDPDSILTGRWM